MDQTSEQRSLFAVQQQQSPRRVSMPDKRNISSDRKRVAGGQEHEVKYEAHKMGASKQEVRRAVHQVGNSRKKVERKLEEGD
jgi:Protein of unknown function (DUF3606)